VTGDYEAFVAGKLAVVPPTGLRVDESSLPEGLFPFQRALVRWALARGRAALFEATGTGKSRQAAAWAQRVREHTGKPVLALAPLAVAGQWAQEASKVGVEVKVCREQRDCGPGVNVTNYDRLHKFDTTGLGGVVWDESSVAKHWTTRTFTDLRDRFEKTPFRLSCTATPAPNDWTELGTQAELLGVCTRAEMLSEYFVHDGGETSVWRLKGHAREAFWRWVASWAAMIAHPRDLGAEFDQSGYDLPPLFVEEHLIKSPGAAAATGSLFAEEAATLAEQRKARRGSVDDRVRACVEQVLSEPEEPWIVWCDLNSESEALAKAIPNSVEVTGSQDIDEKEEKLTAFLRGEVNSLVSKPSICAWGVNAQRCARQAFVGVTHSFESYYQALRRSWRFGQTREVRAHVFASELEGAVVASLKRKERDNEEMVRAMIMETRDAVRKSVLGSSRSVNDYEPAVEMSVPAWLRSEDP